MASRPRELLRRWWPLPVAVVALLIQWYGWTQAGQRILAAGRAAWPVVRWAWLPLAAGLLIAWFHRPGVAATIAWLRRLPRFVGIGLLAAGVLGLLMVVFVALPTWFVPDGAIGQAHELYKARNDVRTTAVQATAGIVLLLGAYFTWRQVLHGREQLDVARQGQVTERFTRAIDQLGSDQLDIRLGGIYALERIARDSQTDRPTIAEVLTAYIRQRSPWPPTQPGQFKPDWPLDHQPDLRTRAPDIQAALTVLGRGRFSERAANAVWSRLDLRATDLRKADLRDAHLERAQFGGAHLEGADLMGIHLEGANLGGAHLERAALWYANLKRAHLFGAHLEEANLLGAHLEWAQLNNARLERADLGSAYLEKASLGGAHLEHASLLNTRLEGAHLNGAFLTGANAWDSARWPAGFDWRAAGIVLVDSSAKRAAATSAAPQPERPQTPALPRPRSPMASMIARTMGCPSRPSPTLTSQPLVRPGEANGTVLRDRRGRSCHNAARPGPGLTCGENRRP